MQHIMTEIYTHTHTVKLFYFQENFIRLYTLLRTCKNIVCVCIPRVPIRMHILVSYFPTTVINGYISSFIGRKSGRKLVGK